MFKGEKQVTLCYMVSFIQTDNRDLLINKPPPSWLSASSLPSWSSSYLEIIFLTRAVLVSCPLNPPQGCLSSSTFWIKLFAI